MPDKEPGKVAGITIPDWLKRVVAGVLTAALVAVGSISFSVYNDNASHKKDIAYLMKRDEQNYAALVELDRGLRELKEEMMQSNDKFHSQAITKINELLARDRYRGRSR